MVNASHVPFYLIVLHAYLPLNALFVKLVFFLLFFYIFLGNFLKNGKCYGCWEQINGGDE